jgi:hypothetical protein
MKEIVNANAKVYGEINQSYFVPPWVDFTNTNVDTERFDRYKLQTWRDELPEGQNYHWHYDLGLKAVWIKYKVVFTSLFNILATQTSGVMQSEGFAILTWESGNNWYCELLHGGYNDPTCLQGTFTIVCNPTTIQQQSGTVYDTQQFLQPVNLPLSVILHTAKMQVNNSVMDMTRITNNSYFSVNLTAFDFRLVGGE